MVQEPIHLPLETHALMFNDIEILKWHIINTLTLIAPLCEFCGFPGASHHLLLSDCTNNYPFQVQLDQITHLLLICNFGNPETFSVADVELEFVWIFECLFSNFWRKRNSGPKKVVWEEDESKSDPVIHKSHSATPCFLTLYSTEFGFAILQTQLLL